MGVKSGHGLILFAIVVSLGLVSGCDDPEPDCVKAGTCQCRNSDDCPDGQHCVDGRCRPIEGSGEPQKGFGESCLSAAQCLSGI